MTIDKRWSRDCVDWVKFAPWFLYKGDSGADGELPEEVVKESQEEGDKDRESGPRVVFRDVRESVPRDFQVRWEDAYGEDGIGPSPNCPGCRSWDVGRSRQPHTAACRERFKKHLEGKARYRNAERKKKEFTERQARRSEEGGAQDPRVDEEDKSKRRKAEDKAEVPEPEVDRPWVFPSASAGSSSSSSGVKVKEEVKRKREEEEEDRKMGRLSEEKAQGEMDEEEKELHKMLNAKRKMTETVAKAV